MVTKQWERSVGTPISRSHNTWVGVTLDMSTLRLHAEPMVLRIARAIAQYIGFGDDDIEKSVATPLSQSHQIQAGSTLRGLRLVQPQGVVEQSASHKWQRHPQLRSYEAPISSDVREGRHHAVRGLFAARAGALDVAREHFSRAAQCSEVDLTAVPGFWKLTRGQMQTAVDAYESVNRYRDAAALDAHIATIFRPSLVGSTMQPIVPTRPQHKAANT